MEKLFFSADILVTTRLSKQSSFVFIFFYSVWEIQQSLESISLSRPTGQLCFICIGVGLTDCFPVITHTLCISIERR